MECVVCHVARLDLKMVEESSGVDTKEGGSEESCGLGNSDSEVAGQPR